MRLRVLSWNIAIGGEAVDLQQVVAGIRTSGADVACLQECEGNAPRIAALLGWAHVDERHQVVSRFPIVEPHVAGGAAVFVLPAPDRVVAVANIHLPSDPYGPYVQRDGATDEEVLELERTVRLAPFERMAASWHELFDIGLPMVIAGDTNAPSHLDHAFPWPVSSAAAALGLVDVYRTANPDRRGITWTWGFPHPRRDPDELSDRIDVVWASSGAVVDAGLVGPADVPDVTVAIDPFPSDHLGVIATLDLEPVQPPPYVGVRPRRVDRGDSVEIRHHAPGGAATDRLVVVRSGASADDPIVWLTPREVEHHGSVRVGTATLGLGAHDVVLTSDGVELGRAMFTVVEPGALPTVAARRVGGAIEVAWSSAPGRKFDWIGVYARRDPDLMGGVLAQAHTGATVDGSCRFEAAPVGPLTVRLCSDDSYVVLAETELD
jgi:endonuclease/exonuclease/phosphatase family metal-dependent hydrolase